MTLAFEVRPARPHEAEAIHDVMAPEVAAGTVLPREVRTEDFWVASRPNGEIIGVVALSAWSNRVVELGSLVSARPGAGVGQALVDAVLEAAARQGFEEVVALTSIDQWFERIGFSRHRRAPWQAAQAETSPLSLVDHRQAAPETRDAVLHEAVDNKSRMSCRGCPRLSACRQHLMVRSVSWAQRCVA